MRSNKVIPEQDSSSTKSLTPQRKHRKLLKDGSSEVWPEEVEKVFVEGLRQYWDSPWATYSRGRSRWRNQFLVDFLRRNGVDRSKKQVASHIQVLRNMWKGEPEFSLVAGGEELFLETGLRYPTPKSEEQPETNTLISMDGSPTHMLLPVHGSAPVRSPVSAQAFSGSAPYPDPSAHPDSRSLFSNDRRICPLPTSEMTASHTARRLSPISATLGNFSDNFQPSENFPSVDSLYPIQTGYGESYGYSTASTGLHSDNSPRVKAESPSSDSPDPFGSALPFVGSDSPPMQYPGRSFLRLVLSAEGMQPFVVPLNADFGSIAVMKVKLRLPALDAPYSPTLHGFQGTITYAAMRSSSARCSTMVFVRNQCISRELETCSVTTVENFNGTSMSEQVTAQLPESSLSRCRWLEASVPTAIIQRIAVDGEEIAMIVYDLDRGQCENMPSAEFFGWQSRRAENTPSRTAYVYDSHSAQYPQAPLTSCIPRAVTSAQSMMQPCALSTVNTHTPSIDPYYYPSYALS